MHEIGILEGQWLSNFTALAANERIFPQIDTCKTLFYHSFKCNFEIVIISNYMYVVRISGFAHL